MTVKQLRAFLAVAQTLSFTRACERLHLSQPALSLAIKGLEETLGGPLLIRSTRSVRLTPEGEALLPLAKRLQAFSLGGEAHATGAATQQAAPQAQALLRLGRRRVIEWD